MSKFNIVKTKIANNTHVLDVFSTTDLISAWEQTTGKEIAQEIGETTRFAAGHASKQYWT